VRRLLLAAAATRAAISSAAVAKDPEFVKASAVADKPSATLDPMRAHILLRSPTQTSLYFMKMPSAEDQVVYDGMRAEALADARRSYAKKLANYERDRASATQARTRPPERPVEPTEANFEFTPFELLTTVPIGPTNRFAKGPGGASTYLHAVTPGRYRVYGPIAMGANNAVIGSCYCMGSVAFEAKAGEIVDISALGGMEPPTMAGTTMLAPEGKPVVAAPAVDPRLAGATIRTALFTPVGKLPNHYGIAITRMPAMPGVMRYDRDRIVDLTGGR